MTSKFASNFAWAVLIRQRETSKARLTQRACNQSIIKIMAIVVHGFDNQIAHQRLHFHSNAMHNKTLNCAIHEQHHWQNQNSDDLKYGTFECISAEMSHPNECFNQHDESDQSLQPYSRTCAHRLTTTRQFTPHVAAYNRKQ